METKQGLNVGVKSFIGAIIVIFVLMAVSYPRWFKWSVKFQLSNLLLTALLLLLGLAVGY